MPMEREEIFKGRGKGLGTTVSEEEDRVGSKYGPSTLWRTFDAQQVILAASDWLGRAKN